MGDAWKEDLNLSATARRLINDDPALMSLLYDLDLLPEQLLAQDEKTPGLMKAYHRLYGVLYAYQAFRDLPPREPAAQDPALSREGRGE